MTILLDGLIPTILCERYVCAAPVTRWLGSVSTNLPYPAISAGAAVTSSNRPE